MHPVLIMLAAKALELGVFDAWRKGKNKRLLRARRRTHAPRDVTAETEVVSAERGSRKTGDAGTGA